MNICNSNWTPFCLVGSLVVFWMIEKSDFVIENKCVYEKIIKFRILTNWLIQANGMKKYFTQNFQFFIIQNDLEWNSKLTFNYSFVTDEKWNASFIIFKFKINWNPINRNPINPVTVTSTTLKLLFLQHFLWTLFLMISKCSIIVFVI